MDFDDQVYALQCLSRMLPDDWKIAVKENPKQNNFQRGRLFFERLRALRNVVYVSPSTSTYHLMEHAQFVATISGTAGWEAIKGGKRVLVFGRAWYTSLPGVSVYRNDVVLEDLEAVRSFAEVKAALDELLSRCGRGVVDPVFTGLVPAFDEADNARHVVSSIRGALECPRGNAA